MKEIIFIDLILTCLLFWAAQIYCKALVIPGVFNIHNVSYFKKSERPVMYWVGITLEGVFIVLVLNTIRNG